MNNKNKFKQLLDFSNSDYVYIMIAMQRAKDGGKGSDISSEYRNNKMVKSMIIESIEDYEYSFRTLCNFANQEWDSYRIYITVNPRSIRKAFYNYQKHILELHASGDDDHLHVIMKRLGSRYKSFLQRPDAKAKCNYFLLDIDSEEAYKKLQGHDLDITITFKTKNGYHVLIPPCNPATIPAITDMEIKRDNLLLLGFSA